MARQMDSTHRTGRKSGCPYDVLVPYLSYLGRATARKMGVHPEDLDICERTFVENMILLNERKMRSLIASGSFGWIHSCARDHARAFRRELQHYRCRTPVARKRSNGLDRDSG